MPTFTVHFKTWASATATVEVPEGTPVMEIEDAAYQNLNASLCHQCASEVEIGDWSPISTDDPALPGEPAVFDADGNAVTEQEG